MSTCPLVSVIIPCKDAEPYLATAIESCLSQTWKNIEVIVVDNGSCDRSVSIAESYRCKGVTTLYCERRGGSAARNMGIARSAGKYVQFLDADDILHHRKFELQLARLSAEEKDTTAICGWGFFQDSIERMTPGDTPMFRDYEPLDFLVQLWSDRRMMATCAWLTDREVIENAGPWSEDLEMDQDGEFFARVALASRRIVCCDGILGFYRRQRGAMTVGRRRDRKALESAFVAYERATTALLATEDSTRTRLAAAGKYLYFVHIGYPGVPELVREAEKRIYAFGGKVEPPKSSKKYEAVSMLLGWKLARRIQLWWLQHRNGYTPVLD
jgi:glycosyltransferase involved in cell wall biosynthesis